MLRVSIGIALPTVHDLDPRPALLRARASLWRRRRDVAALSLPVAGILIVAAAAGLLS